MHEGERTAARWDVRGRGFADRTPLADAIAWLDGLGFERPPERIAPGAALGRVLARAVVSTSDFPPLARALIDGYALAAENTEGASAYNPLPFAFDRTAGCGRVVPVRAGDPLPAGADAVAGFANVARRGAEGIEILASIAPGEGVEARADAAPEGTTLLRPGHRLAPQDLALLALLDLGQLPVVPRPRVALVVPGPKGSEPEALSPMLEALIARDGATALTPVPRLCPGRPRADVLIIAGRSGAGTDDDAASELVAAGGSIACHGIALRPGGSAGLGEIGGEPVLLLPGGPLACFVAYDVLAARLIRRLAGLSSALPYASARFPLARKIVSAIGLTEVVPVAIAEGRATPLARTEGVELAAVSGAAGFVIVPAAFEGHAPGESVVVHLYSPPCATLGGVPFGPK